MSPTSRAPVADGVWRLGNDVVNCYVLADDGAYTVVDAGCPKHFRQVATLLHSRGDGLDRLEAVVLTHAHEDHLGFAEEARSGAGADVHVHEDDDVVVRGGDDGRDTEAGLLGYVWRPAALRTFFQLMRDGGTKIPPVQETLPFVDGAVLDVPGALEVVHAPGHTRGNVALHAPERGVLFTGDALVTWNPLTGRSGPQIMPAAFNESSEQAMASLGRLEALDAGVLVPGHGDPWSQGAARAVERAREAGPS